MLACLQTLVHTQFLVCPAQSLALAPLFVWLETLFVIGYRPQLRAALDERVKRNLQDVQSKQEPLLKPPVEGR